ncbi:inorganic phosphate transporter [Actinomyces sp. zg-332]|uniref:inorganic phosphate transporter n=1 Tax=Actinomyces sp. zg-332 TaxID=2708340 RepID=UPI0014248221|nr:inorganic phosphate transporter [Actinomyces sp. zg-332]QPK94199.1 inorganic phosphate transporter [Actinomyces sp. zg-332]
MDATFILVSIVIIIALVFDFTNGFHDAANAIATSVSTRAWTPRRALIMAAILNIIGAMLGTEVAKTIGSGIITPETNTHGLIVILSALLGAIVWNMITWWFGLPSSSSHALIGGLIGAGLVAGLHVAWFNIVFVVIIPMIISPLIGFGLGYLVMIIAMLFLRNKPYHSTMRKARYCQWFSSAAIALGHGLQDAQKTMGVIVLALMAAGYHAPEPDGEITIPFLVKFAAALAISLGTYAGGFKIIKTLGRKVIQLDPLKGFVAESVGASVLYLSAYVFHAPISTTHTITASIMGVGATRRFSAVRWGVAGNIAVAWVLTLPASGVVAAICYYIMHALYPL